MPRFSFRRETALPADGGQVRITGPDAVHIRRSLRMREERPFSCATGGDRLFL